MSNSTVSPKMFFSSLFYLMFVLQFHEHGVMGFSKFEKQCTSYCGRNMKCEGGTCVCEAGYEIFDWRRCLKIKDYCYRNESCNYKSYCDLTVGRCKCKDGYKMEYGFCQLSLSKLGERCSRHCSTYMECQEGTCVCKAGYKASMFETYCRKISNYCDKDIDCDYKTDCNLKTNRCTKCKDGYELRYDLCRLKRSHDAMFFVTSILPAILVFLIIIAIVLRCRMRQRYMRSNFQSQQIANQQPTLNPIPQQVPYPTANQPVALQQAVAYPTNVQIPSGHHPLNSFNMQPLHQQQPPYYGVSPPNYTQVVPRMQNMQPPPPYESVFSSK